MNRETYDNLLRWSHGVLHGEDDDQLWRGLTEAQAEFSPLAYVLMALKLPLLGQKALALASGTHWSGQDLDMATLCHCLGQWVSQGQLERWGCFDLQQLSIGIVRPVSRVTAFVVEEAYVDSGIAGLTLWSPSPLPQSIALDTLAGHVNVFCQRADCPTTFVLWGEMGAGRRTLAKTVAKKMDTPLLLANLEEMPPMHDQSLENALLVECRLMGCPVCVCCGTVEGGYLPTLLRTLTQEVGIGFLVAQESWHPEGGDDGWQVFPVALPLPDVETSRGLWNTLLHGQPLASDVDVETLAMVYRFTAGQMKQAIAVAKNKASWQGEIALTMAYLHQGCRSQLRHSLGDKAKRIDPAFTWGDLVLPKASLELLASACDRMNHRGQVLERWGFSAKLPYGGGLSLLFSGPPGTGKTMGAQIMAAALGLELYKVDLATVVSKYVGETEKNLSIIFREAQRSGAVLFFDEADALFGKRTEVKDAHDRYSNMEAAYLLQRVEEYSGVSILATNYLQNIDDAFRRRLTYIVEFPFPNGEQRLALWSRAFPKETPLDDQIDWEFLAHTFELSGSSIKNCAVAAAFLASGQGVAVNMGHTLLAVRRELEKSGKTIAKEEFGPYYMLLP